MATQWMTDEEAAVVIEKGVRRGRCEPAFKDWKRMTQEQREGYRQALDLYDEKHRPEKLAWRRHLQELCNQRPLYTPFTAEQVKQWEAALAGKPCPKADAPARSLAADAAMVGFAAAGQVAGLCLFLINPVGALLLIGLLAESAPGRR